jgi:hypothetical protein
VYALFFFAKYSYRHIFFGVNERGVFVQPCSGWERSIAWRTFIRPQSLVDTLSVFLERTCVIQCCIYALISECILLSIYTFLFERAITHIARIRSRVAVCGLLMMLQISFSVELNSNALIICE